MAVTINFTEATVVFCTAQHDVYHGSGSRLVQFNFEIQLKACRTTFEYSTTTLKDHASDVYLVHLHVESFLKYLISTSYLPFLCVWLCGKLGYLRTLLLIASPRVNPCSQSYVDTYMHCLSSTYKY